MPDLWFDLDADTTLARLERDPTSEGLFAAIRQVLRHLEADPGAGSMRAIRFQDPPLWWVAVAHRDDDWAVLWGPHPVAPQALVIHYIGPGNFR